MECSKYHELISARLDGEISKEDERLLEEHLASCGECSAFYKSMIELQHSLKNWHNEKLPANIESAVLERAVSHPGHNPISRLFRNHYRIPRVVAWGALLLILVLAVNDIIPVFNSGDGKIQSTKGVNENVTVTKIKITKDDIIGRTVLNKENKL